VAGKPCSCTQKIKLIGACASTILISTNITQKNPLGLPRIDQVVDSTTGCSMLSFLDCYSEYHQISLAKEDKEKTAFITPFGAFCYTSMSFGPKNAGATYQRAI
jgi:hypothetical protein